MYPTKPITLDDVASAAGVSKATVSQVLSGKGRVSEATRVRVSQLADELGYVVNVGARNLRQERAGSIGLCLPPETTSLAYYMECTFGVIERAQAEGVAVTLLLNRGHHDAPSLRSVHVDGFVIVDPEAGDEFANQILASNRVVVSGERVTSANRQPHGTVLSDHRTAIRELLMHLKREGAESIGMILPGVETAWAAELQEEYFTWCHRQQVEPLVARSSRRVTASDAQRTTTDMLRAARRPDAIISTPDGSALGAIAAIRAEGLEVGRDVLLAGYGDSLSLQMGEPPITAVDLRPREFGAQCAELLLQILADASLREEPQLREHAVTLQARPSTRRA